jgi:hypothetical protein
MDAYELAQKIADGGIETWNAEDATFDQLRLLASALLSLQDQLTQVRAENEEAWRVAAEQTRLERERAEAAEKREKALRDAARTT